MNQQSVVNRFNERTKQLEQVARDSVSVALVDHCWADLYQRICAESDFSVLLAEGVAGIDDDLLYMAQSLFPKMDKYLATSSTIPQPVTDFLSGSSLRDGFYGLANQVAASDDPKAIALRLDDWMLAWAKNVAVNPAIDSVAIERVREVVRWLSFERISNSEDLQIVANLFVSRRDS